LLAFLPSRAGAQSTPGASAVARVHAFLLQTVGQPQSQRIARATAILDSVNPLDQSTLLVEIAAIGMLARASSTRTALREDYPARSKTALELAQRQFGRVGWTQALHGAWHYEIASRSSVAALFYSASQSEGEAHFQRARQLSPGDAGIPLAHAIALLSNETEGNARQALVSLRSAPQMPSSPYANLVLRHSKHLIGLLTAGKSTEAGNYAQSIY
jgi:hypothetical protein